MKSNEEKAYLITFFHDKNPKKRLKESLSLKFTVENLKFGQALLKCPAVIFSLTYPLNLGA